MNFEKIYKHDIFANEAGVILDELNDQRAVMHITVNKSHLNAGNVAHGGVLFLLADIAMAAIANQRQAISVSIQSDIRFIAAALEGDKLTAIAEFVYGRKKLSNCRVKVTNQNDEIIAIAEGMFHIKPSAVVNE